MWYIYAIYSKVSDIIYVGMSETPERRLQEHNSGKVRSTKAHTPWYCFYIEEAATDTEQSRKREKYYKSAAGKRFLRKELEKFKIN